jgi:hypothetical protein
MDDTFNIFLHIALEFIIGRTRLYKAYETTSKEGCSRVQGNLPTAPTTQYTVLQDTVRGGAIRATEAINSRKNRTPLEMGRVERIALPSAGGGGSILCTHRKGRRSGRSMGAQEPCGEAAAGPSS